VTDRLNALQEITLGELSDRAQEKPAVLSLAGILGKQTFATGIELRWLDGETAELRARQYADWPESPGDHAALPWKQGQLLAERALLHISRRPDGCTRVDYELYVPTWVYVMAVAMALLVLWGASCLQDSVVRLAGLHGASLWFRTSQIAYAVLLAWLLTRLIPMLRLQSVSLFDSLGGSLGEMRRG
jgi:hypothetical protein